MTDKEKEIVRIQLKKDISTNTQEIAEKDN